MLNTRATVGVLLTLLLGALSLGLGGCAAKSVSSTSVTVNASDSSCAISASKLNAGPTTFNITNTGSRVNEFYVFAAGDRIVGEVENIGPGLSRNLIVNLTKGTYQGACKPGMVGNGIRQTITVTAKAT